MRIVMIGMWLFFAACYADDRCGGDYGGCTNDEQCHLNNAPYGRCLDDHETGRICAFYWFTCPTKLQWAECGGAPGHKSSWAGRCVRPEFLGDAGMKDAEPVADASTEAGIQ